MYQRKKHFNHLVKLVLYANLGVIMFVSYILMQWAPNIHLLGVLTMAYTLAFGFEALVPIYVYVFLNGLYSGFAPWWIPYLYVWAILWGITMLLPKNIKPHFAAPLYMIICGAHGLLFGLLYLPMQIIILNYDIKQALVWLAVGLTFDITHAVSNTVLALLVLPISNFLSSINKKYISK